MPLRLFSRPTLKRPLERRSFRLGDIRRPEPPALRKGTTVKKATTESASSARTFTVKQVALLVVAVAAVGALLPMGAGAVGGQLVTLVDGPTSTKARVDPGNKLRVGDGAGALTVDEVGARILATGTCNDGSSGAVQVSLPNTAARRIVGAYLGPADNGTFDARLALTAPGAAAPFANLLSVNLGGPPGPQIDFGPGISAAGPGSWVFRCTTNNGNTAGSARWFVWGY